MPLAVDKESVITRGARESNKGQQRFPTASQRPDEQEVLVGGSSLRPASVTPGEPATIKATKTLGCGVSCRMSDRYAQDLQWSLLRAAFNHSAWFEWTS
jgi:hypothetical protein